ncbi:MAG: hypothetical protein ACOCX3_03580 [Chloroflexota bacterium]
MTTRQNPASRPAFQLNNTTSSPAYTGYYCWGGPGTIRMIGVKEFAPRIDEHSLLTCYDYDYVARVQELFGVTDYWVMYSWGFADATEAEDRRFIAERIDNFKRLGIRVHGYIQGPNLVYDEFPQVDWWARDHRHRRITYYRGRHMCSIHHEGYAQYVLNKIRGTYDLGFDGIFVDNIQHGQLGVPAAEGRMPFVFCGDYSPAARAAFRAETGQDIPTDLELDPDLTRLYLDFRARANEAFIGRLAEATHEGGMVFGTNFYDPKFHSLYTYGIDLKRMSDLQDYVLFENHSLPRHDGKRHNGYIEDIVAQHDIDKPVFLVSYENGVGMAPQFRQEQIDNLFSEAARSRFHLCLKGSEFTTKGVWHCLYLDDITPPAREKVLPRQANVADTKRLETLLALWPLRQIIKRYYNPITTMVFEWRIFRVMLKVIYDLAIK